MKTGSERNFQLSAFESSHTWPFPGKSTGQRSNLGTSVEQSCGTYTVLGLVLYYNDGRANETFISINRENQGLLSLPLIHLSENISPFNALPFRAIFPQFKLLLNSSFLSVPDYKLFLISISSCARCNSLCECLLILPLLPSHAASTSRSLLYLYLLLYPAARLRAAAHTPAKRYLIISILSAKAFGETVY